LNQPASSALCVRGPHGLYRFGMCHVLINIFIILSVLDSVHRHIHINVSQILKLVHSDFITPHSAAKFCCCIDSEREKSVLISTLLYLRNGIRTGLQLNEVGLVLYSSS